MIATLIQSNSINDIQNQMIGISQRRLSLKMSIDSFDRIVSQIFPSLEFFFWSTFLSEIYLH